MQTRAGGHLGYFEQHEQFNQIVLDWLAGKGLLPSATYS